MKYFDQNNRPDPDPEYNSEEIMVETAGYVPADVQIETMIEAGIRLGEYRKEMYDSVSDDPDIELDLDPTRARGFDLAEGTLLSRDVTARLEEQARVAKEKESEKVESESKVEDKEGQ